MSCKPGPIFRRFCRSLDLCQGLPHRSCFVSVEQPLLHTNQADQARGGCSGGPPDDDGKSNRVAPLPSTFPMTMPRMLKRRRDQSPSKPAKCPNSTAAAIQASEIAPVVSRTCQSSGYNFIRLLFSEPCSVLAALATAKNPRGRAPRNFRPAPSTRRLCMA
jgi:hypothetical protein